MENRHQIVSSGARVFFKSAALMRLLLLLLNTAPHRAALIAETHISSRWQVSRSSPPREADRRSTDWRHFFLPPNVSLCNTTLVAEAETRRPEVVNHAVFILRIPFIGAAGWRLKCHSLNTSFLVWEGEVYFFFCPCLSRCLTDRYRSGFIINPAGDNDFSGRVKETTGFFFVCFFLA